MIDVGRLSKENGIGCADGALAQIENADVTQMRAGGKIDDVIFRLMDTDMLCGLAGEKRRGMRQEVRRIGGDHRNESAPELPRRDPVAPRGGPSILVGGQ